MYTKYTSWGNKTASPQTHFGFTIVGSKIHWNSASVIWSINFLNEIPCSYASDSYLTNKASGSNCKIRSDFRHWTRANIRPVRPNPWSNLWWNVSGKSLYQNLTQLDVNKQNTVLDQKILRGIFTWSEPYPNFLSPFLNYFQRKTVWKFQIVYLKRAFSLKESMKNDQK